MRVAEYPLSMLHWVIRRDPWVRAIFLAAGVKLDELAERILDVSTFEDSEAMMSRSLALWERILGITPEDGATEEARRADVRAMWLASLPPSIATIQAVCDAWRAGEISAEYEAGIGTIVLYYLRSFGPQEGQAGLVRALDIVKPAHLALEHAWRYYRVKEVHRQVSVAELEKTPRGWFGGYRARLLPGTPREYRTASGAAASFWSPGEHPLRGCTVKIKPAQAGSGDPSPTNIKPITGWTGCSVSVSGADTGNPTVYPVSWQTEAGTVYGGTIDVTAGVLTVTHAYHAFDGTESIGANSSGNSFYANYNVGDYGSVKNNRIICSHGVRKSLSPSNTVKGVDIFNSGASQKARMTMRFDGAGSSSASYMAFLAEQYANGTPVQAVWELSSPVTVQLAPQEVTALAGANTVRADTGDVTVEYVSAESAKYALSGTDRFRGSGILRFGACLAVRERSKITVEQTGDRLDIGSGMTYEAPAYEQIGDGLWSVDGALTVAADSMVTARKDGDTLMIANKKEEE